MIEMKVVVFGGGNGSKNVLKALKKIKDIQITAITACFDSGGSTGRIRKQYGGIGLGDIRRSIGALCENDIEKILEYRFDKGEFCNHAFGNIFLLALKNVFGNELKAIKKACKLFNAKGKVLPPSLDSSNLCAKLENGEIIKGEGFIDLLNRRCKPYKIKDVWLEPKAKALKEVKNEIKDADIIIFSPGDIFSSLIQILLVDGISQSLSKSKAKKIYVCNLVARNEFSYKEASELIKMIERYGKTKIDLLIADSSKVKLKNKIIIDKCDCKIIKCDVASNKIKGHHDPEKLRRCFEKIFKSIQLKPAA